MTIFNHWPALLAVLVIVLIVWGPGKLPEVGSAIGKAMREFRRQSSDFQDEIRKSTTPSDSQGPIPPTSDVTPTGDVKPTTDIKS